MRNPFARLARSNVARPSLRERAAALKASASRVIRRKPVDAVAVAAAPDLVFAMIDEARRLMRTSDALHARPSAATREAQEASEQENTEALRALWAHCDATILQTVPRTATGCRELARFAVEYFESNQVPISDDETLIAGLIARSPLLDGTPPLKPVAPDFSGSSAIDLMRTYNALKMATDIFGLTGWTVSREDIGLNLLDEEGDRLSFFQDYIADELKRRDLPDRTHAGHRADTVINRAVACGDYEEAAHFAAEAAARHL